MQEQALDYLITLIQSGYEYPDAEWKASQKFGISCDELRELYDAIPRNRTS